MQLIREIFFKVLGERLPDPSALQLRHGLVFRRTCYALLASSLDRRLPSTQLALTPLANKAPPVLELSVSLIAD